MDHQIDKFFNIIKNSKEFAYDVETNGLDWKRCYVCGYSVSNGHEAVYIPVRHSANNIECIDAFEHDLARLVNNYSGKIIGHNIKFDCHFSENHGIILGNKQIDTMIMEALLNENRRSYSLKSVASNYDIAQKKDKDLYEHIARKFTIKPDRNSMGYFHRLAGDDPIAHEYAGGDTLSTYQLHEKQKKELYRQELDMVVDLENQLTYVLQKMERRGIGLNKEEVEKVKLEIDELYIDSYTKIPMVDKDGEIKTININSGKDLKEYFEMCEIDDWPMTAPTERFPDGQPSFKKEYLMLSEEGLNILNARKLGHLKNSFLDVLDNHLFNNNIHTTFNQTRGETHGTRTGRLSSSYPNMQQIPKRDEFIGKIYRRMFVPRNNYIYVEFDYSQAEPRLYSHYSNEPSLINGYNSIPYIDMHQICAELLNIERKVAKNLNLGLMYTMGAYKLSIQLGVSYNEALYLLKRWHKMFPYVSEFTKKALKKAEDRGYVKTILGRRKRFPDLRFSYRAANAIIQGGSADIIKFKMVELDRWLTDNKYEDVVRMLLTIHDSLVFEVHKDYTHLMKEIKVIMQNVQIPPFNLKIPFVADGKYGDNWAKATYDGTTVH